MTFTRVISITVFLLFVWLLTSDGAGQQKAEESKTAATPRNDGQKKSSDEDELSTFMRKKLAASNTILEGLVTDDLELATEGADILLEMSDAEKWRASNDMMYMHHSREFRRSVEALKSKAKKKSIDGSALAWVDVTMNCIQCHEWVRDTMLADGTAKFKDTKQHSGKLSLNELLGNPSVK